MEHFPLNERLHTDVLEEKYGPVHVEVLQHADGVRKAHLVDEHGVSRTFAVTFLPDSWANEEIAEVNEKIAAGGAIGKTFRAYGYAIRKNVIDVYVAEVPEWLRDKFASDSPYAKVRLAEFYAKKQGEPPLIYGVVAEVYSPDFRPPIVNQFDESQMSALTDCLNQHSISSEEVWRRIGMDNDYHDLQGELDAAKQDALPQLFKIKERIEQTLKDT